MVEGKSGAKKNGRGKTEAPAQKTNDAVQPAWARTATLQDGLGHGLTEKEYNSIIELLGREINLVEVGICAALYSEHCSYKSTKVHLKTLPTEGPRVVQGPGENAGVVDIGSGLGVVFKVESHNHPTFIEPYQGAATGVGGILRDVFTMGARPIALMNGLRFGTADNARTKYLLSRAVSGIGGYGNCMGIPTVGGELFFHEAYNGNCLVNAFALGIVENKKIFLGRAAGIGNRIIYLGSKTGRDGIHGATMASEAFDENSDEKRPTVQVGDPFQEKLLLEASLAVMESGAVVGIQDMGAAGMTSSTYEMADRAGTGVRVHLDRVPQREDGMTPYEIMLSESQERMVLVVERDRVEEVLQIARRWELDAVDIGEVIDGRDVELYWEGEIISTLPVSLLTSSVPQYRWPEQIPADFESKNSFDLDSIGVPQNLGAAWLDLVGSINCCSRRPVFNQYDSTVRSNTVVHPGGDAAVVRIKNSTSTQLAGPEKGVAMTLDCNSRFCSLNPRDGTAHTVAEACRNLSAVGAEPIGISDCLNFGSPERPEGMWQIAESIRGLGDAARAFNVPIVSGNVSLYNETKGRGILPTPTIAMVGLLEDASVAVGSHFVAEGDVVLLLGSTISSELGGGEYLATIHQVERGPLPRLEYDLEMRANLLIRELIQSRVLKSCHDLSAGGLGVALVESCCAPYSRAGPSGKALGVNLQILIDDAGRRDGILFAESGARFLVSCAPDQASQVIAVATARQIPVSMRGTVGGDSISVAGVATISLPEAYERWRTGLGFAFGDVP